MLAIKYIKFLVVLNGKLNRKQKSLKNTRKIFLQPQLIQIKIVLYISDLCFHLIISDSVIVLRGEVLVHIGVYPLGLFFYSTFLLTFPLKRITSCLVAHATLISIWLVTTAFNLFWISPAELLETQTTHAFV